MFLPPAGGVFLERQFQDRRKAVPLPAQSFGTPQEASPICIRFSCDRFSPTPGCFETARSGTQIGHCSVSIFVPGFLRLRFSNLLISLKTRMLCPGLLRDPQLAPTRFFALPFGVSKVIAGEERKVGDSRGVKHQKQALDGRRSRKNS